MRARVIAYYLPQFHPIPENDEAWGPGFTEWKNVVKARPLFRGHYQPRIPADLGFYDLRLPEVREQQAQMAREAGIEGFCYWHYWFGKGKMLLQRPFQEVLASGKPDFPFCLAWANHDWTTGTWKKSYREFTNEIIAKQEYLGIEDYTLHFNYCLPAFKDKRYITVDGKPLFVIYEPYHFKDVTLFMETWRKLAEENGLKGIHFVGIIKSTSTVKRQADGTLTRTMPNLKSSADVYNNILKLGFDGLNSLGKTRAEMLSIGKYNMLINEALRKKLPFLPALKYNYPKVVKHFFAPEDVWENIYPTIMPQWDRSPRIGKSYGIYVKSTPEAFKEHVMDAINVIKDKSDEHKILFLRSWNEWAEGNYVEPDEKYGRGYLNVLGETLND